MAQGVAFTNTGILLGATGQPGVNANSIIDASGATDAFSLPVGSSGQRPAGQKGMIRFNSQTSQFEGFVFAWQPLGGGQVVVMANGTAINSTSILNFINTASVTVAVGDDYANGRINIALTSLGGGGGGTINVEANTAGAVLNVANINFNNTSTVNTSVQSAVNKAANIAFVANVAAITALTEANVTLAFNQANAAYNEANTAETDAQTGITNAGLAYAQANAARSQANSAYAQANAAYAAANGAGNTVAVFEAGTLVLADANLNFNNTQSINLLATANGTGQVNVQANINLTLNLVSLNVSTNIANAGNVLVTQNVVAGNVGVSGAVTVGSGLPTSISYADAVVIGGQPPQLYMQNQQVAANTGLWLTRIDSSGEYLVEARNDNIANINQMIKGVRTAGTSNITSIVLGNSNDLPTVNVLGFLNVTANIANTGNLAVTQNTVTGNLSVTTLTNTSILNVGTDAVVTRNLSAGNVSTTNLNVTSIANVAILNVSSSITDMGYLKVQGGLPGTGTINVGGFTLGSQAFGNTQSLMIFCANSAVDNGWWEIVAQNTGILQFRAANDTYGNATTWLKVQRANANANIGTITLGDTNDQPVTTILGNLKIQRAAGSISGWGGFAVTDTTHVVLIDSNTATGSWNPLATGNDAVVIATNAAANLAGLTLSTWAANAGGIRITNNQIMIIADNNQGNVNVNAATLNVNTHFISAGNAAASLFWDVANNSLNIATSATTNTNQASLIVNRIANYSDGTSPGYVIGTVRINDTVTSNIANNYEWALTSVMNNQSSGGQQVAIYGQANRQNTFSGATWAGVSELRETTPITNPTSGSVTHEFDMRVNGTDNNANRVILDAVVSKYNTAAAAANAGVTFGYRLQMNNDMTGNCQVGFGYSIYKCNVVWGFDTATSVVQSGALRMAQGQSIAFDAAGNNQLLLDTVGLVYRNSGNSIARWNPNAEVVLTDVNTSGHWTRLNANLAASNYNPTVQANDHALIFSDGLSDTGNLVIAPWSNTASGIRIGNLSVNVLSTLNSSGEGVYANGTVVIGGVANLNFNNTATINVSATANGSLQSNVSFNANLAAIQTQILSERFVATANQTLFTLTNAALLGGGAPFLIVTRNGLVLEPTNHYTYASGVVTTSANCSVGDLIEVREFTTANLASPSTIKVETFTSTTNQSSFVLQNALNSANVNFLFVFRNGIEQCPGTHYTLAGQTLTFTSNTILNDLIEVRELIGVTLQAPSAILTETFTATANQSVFTLNNTVNPANNTNYLFVYINGIEQQPTTHYTLSGQTLTFTANCAVNDKVEVREFIAINAVGAFLAAGQNQQVQFNNGGSLAGNSSFIYDTANGVVTITQGTGGPVFGNSSNDAVILYANSTSGTGNVSIRFTDNGLVKARIGVQMNGSGSYMTLGISNNFSTGITGGASLDQNGNFSANNFTPVWTNFTLNTSAWTTSTVCQYWVDPFGICHLRGLASNTGTVNNTVGLMTTPGYRIATGLPAPVGGGPLYPMIQGWTSGSQVPGAAGVIALKMYSDGIMQVETTMLSTGNITWVCFDGVTYPTK